MAHIKTGQIVLLLFRLECSSYASEQYYIILPNSLSPPPFKESFCFFFTVHASLIYSFVFSSFRIFYLDRQIAI